MKGTPAEQLIADGEKREVKDAVRHGPMGTSFDVKAADARSKFDLDEDNARAALLEVLEAMHGHRKESQIRILETAATFYGLTD